MEAPKSIMTSLLYIEQDWSKRPCGADDYTLHLLSMGTGNDAHGVFEK